VGKAAEVNNPVEYGAGVKAAKELAATNRQDSEAKSAVRAVERSLSWLLRRLEAGRCALSSVADKNYLSQRENVRLNIF
jgi:hypothetical protein